MIGSTPVRLPFLCQLSHSPPRGRRCLTATSLLRGGKDYQAVDPSQTSALTMQLFLAQLCWFLSNPVHRRLANISRLVFANVSVPLCRVFLWRKAVGLQKPGKPPCFAQPDYIGEPGKPPCAERHALSATRCQQTVRSWRLSRESGRDKALINMVVPRTGEEQVLCVPRHDIVIPGPYISPVRHRFDNLAGDNPGLCVRPTE